MVNQYKRYQTGLTLEDIFPTIEGKCACSCERELSGRRKRWYSNECQYNAYIKFSIMKGDVSTIRDELFKRDHGACNYCGLISENWEADHIVSVIHGGGGCDINNFQTLCKSCHIAKTNQTVGHSIAKGYQLTVA